METVNKVVHAASTAIWGEGNDNQSTQPHGEEPISGVQGKGAYNDPFDAGNRDEQPSAPTTDIDPLAQEPQVDYKPQTLDAKTDATGTASDIKSTTAVTLPKSTETPSSNTQTAPVATEQRSTESAEKSESTENAESAAAGGSGSGSGSGIGSDKSSNSEEVAAKHGVSKEALVGPQGPAPHPASEFEDEAKGKKPAAKEAKPAEPESSVNSSSAKSDTSTKSPSKTSSGSGDSNNNGKHSTMAKVKEGLKKVAHPRHGSKSSSSS